MLEFGAARITLGDLIRSIKVRAKGGVVSARDIARWRRTRRLETEPLVQVEANEDGIRLWPHRQFHEPAMLHAIESVFSQFGFAIHRQGPRPLTKREYRQLRRSWSEHLLGQAFPDGTHWLEVPLEVRFGPDSAVNDDLRASLGAGAEWKSLKEIRDIVSLARMRHLPPGSTGYEFFM